LHYSTRDLQLAQSQLLQSNTVTCNLPYNLRYTLLQ